MVTTGNHAASASEQEASIPDGMIVVNGQLYQRVETNTKEKSADELKQDNNFCIMIAKSKAPRLGLDFDNASDQFIDLSLRASATLIGPAIGNISQIRFVQQAASGLGSPHYGFGNQNNQFEVGISQQINLVFSSQFVSCVPYQSGIPKAKTAIKRKRDDGDSDDEGTLLIPRRTPIVQRSTLHKGFIRKSTGQTVISAIASRRRSPGTLSIGTVSFLTVAASSRTRILSRVTS